MKKISLMLMLLILSCFSFSQHWEVKNSGSTATFYKVIFLNDSVGYVAGNDNNSNFILKTTNAGETWINTASMVTSKLVKGMYFLNKDTGFVVGKLGSVYKTIDGASIWIARNTGTTSDFNDVCFPKFTNGHAVGKSGNYMTSSNGGNAWGSGPLTSALEFSKIYFQNDTIGYLFCTSSGKTWKTTNGGTTWDTTRTFPQIIHDIHFVNLTLGYIVGESGYVRRTLNGGNTWNNITPDGYTTKSFSCVFALGNDAWIAGDSGLVLYTINGGTSWNIDTTFTNEKVTSMTFTKNKTGFAVGTNGLIMKRVSKKNSGINHPTLLQDEISIFPNPANDKIIVSFNHCENAFFNARIIDLQGKVIQAGLYSQNGNRIVIDLRGITSGVYLLELKDFNGVATKLFILQ